MKKFAFDTKNKLPKKKFLTPLETVEVLPVNFYAKQEAIQKGKKMLVKDWTILNTSLTFAPCGQFEELTTKQPHNINPIIINLLKKLQKNVHPWSMST